MGLECPRTEPGPFPPLTDPRMACAAPLPPPPAAQEPGRGQSALRPSLSSCNAFGHLLPNACSVPSPVHLCWGSKSIRRVSSPKREGGTRACGSPGWISYPGRAIKEDFPGEVAAQTEGRACSKGEEDQKDEVRLPGNFKSLKTTRGRKGWRGKVRVAGAGAAAHWGAAANSFVLQQSGHSMGEVQLDAKG